jgi:RND family efflux transporter MFP subunit
VHWVPGDVVSHEDARVAAEVSGRVERVADVGTQVRKGEIVAWLDATVPALKVRELDATLRRIDAQLAYSRKQEERYAALQREQAVSASSGDQIRAEREIRQHEREIARAVLEEARNRLAHAVIRAPFDGVVAERLVVAGEYLRESEPVVRLVNTGQLEIRARAPIAAARRLAQRDRVPVRDGDEVSEQTLLSFIPVGDSPSRQLELRVSADRLGLPIGTAVEIGVPDGDAGPSITVPRDAVIQRREGTHVVRVDAAGLAVRVAVQTGAAAGDRIAVRGELHEGDRVVVRGGERIQPGQPVREASP